MRRGLEAVEGADGGAWESAAMARTWDAMGGRKPTVTREDPATA